VNFGEDEPDMSEALVGSVQAGRYRVEKLLGSGGMGAVYRAEHVHMRKFVALKVLHREMTLLPEVVKRFEREAVAAASITHPNVAAALDSGRLDDGAFYLVLEYVEGQSLSQLLAREGPLTPERALRIMRQIADALAMAHSVGVVHRDLKPDNIMLVQREGIADFVKVLDFGIAKIKETGEQPALTQLGTIFGTPEYMSPEQARGDHVDARSDLYTLGLILYEMLAGTSPFKDIDVVVVLTRHLTADPPPLPEHVSQVISDLTLRLLRKNPSERVQSAQELVERIDAILSGAPPKSWAAVPLSAQDAPASIAVPSAQAALEPIEQYAKTMLGAGAPPVPASTSKVTAFTQSVLSKVSGIGPSVSIAGKRVSTGILAAVGGLALILGILVTVLVMLANGGSNGGAKAEPLTKPEDPDIAMLVAKAETGDVKAIAELSARPEGDRTATEWRAVGMGYAKLGQLLTAVQTYSAGIKSHEALAADPALISDLRRAADDKEASDDALRVAAEQLGPTGVELIYDVWENAKGRPDKAAVTKLAKTYLDDEALLAKAPAALQILIELPKVQKAEGCPGVKRLLPKIGEVADDRIVPQLKRLNERRGCGFLGLADCYSCLRSTSDLATALQSAQSRPGPQFRASTPTPSPAAAGQKTGSKSR
jgi:serine/threonine-protein kinase